MQVTRRLKRVDKRLRRDDCAEEVSEKEATLSSIRAASAYLSRTVVNRVQKLHPAGGNSFARPARTSKGMSGINAGDETLPDYPPNLAIDIGYSESSGQGPLRSQLSLRSRHDGYAAHTDSVLLGFGVGTEYTHARRCWEGVQRRTQRPHGNCLCLRRFSTKTLLFVPQAALTYLNKKQEVLSRHRKTC